MVSFCFSGLASERVDAYFHSKNCACFKNLRPSVGSPVPKNISGPLPENRERALDGGEFLKTRNAYSRARTQERQCGNRTGHSTHAPCRNAQSSFYLQGTQTSFDVDGFMTRFLQRQRIERSLRCSYNALAREVYWTSRATDTLPSTFPPFFQLDTSMIILLGSYHAKQAYCNSVGVAVGQTVCLIAILCGRWPPGHKRKRPDEQRRR